jgi:hypothetical protein
MERVDGLFFMPSAASGLFGYFGPFVGRERLGSGATTLLTPKTSEGDGMWVFAGIRCRRSRIGRFANRDINDMLRELVWVARSLRASHAL